MALCRCSDFTWKERVRRAICLIFRCASISCFQVVSRSVSDFFQFFSQYNLFSSTVCTVSTVPTVEQKEQYECYEQKKALWAVRVKWAVQAALQVWQVLLAHLRVDFRAFFQKQLIGCTSRKRQGKRFKMNKDDLVGPAIGWKVVLQIRKSVEYFPIAGNESASFQITQTIKIYTL